ncbi:hypothetical protein P0Y35_12180 [Kiritimatiellaeota bacterium B1221]|nr:hypothetical protein [Kiritimatiellaeota bacterium B1221]
METKFCKGVERVLWLAMGTGVFLGGPLAAQPAEAPERGAGWRVSAGPWYRNFEGGTFQTSRPHSAAVDLPRGSTTSVLDSGAAGPASGSAFRSYDDGFVGPDALGSTPGSLFEGTSSRFGYESDAQVSGSSLVMSAVLTGTSSSTSFSSSDESGSWNDDPGSEVGAQIETAYLRPVSAGRVGLLFGFGWSPYKISGEDSTFTASRADQKNRVDGLLTDRYAIPGSVILPSAPYHQPNANPPPAFLPRIYDEPSRSIESTSTRTGTTRYEWFNQINQEFDADVFTFSLGPTAEIDVAEMLFLSLSAGAAFHVVDWQASSTETLYSAVNGGNPETVESWKERQSGTDLILGGYLSCGAGVMFGEGDRYFIQGTARWDWADNLSATVGSTSFEVGFDSFSAMVSAGMRL